MSVVFFVALAVFYSLQVNLRGCTSLFHYLSDLSHLLGGWPFLLTFSNYLRDFLVIDCVCPVACPELPYLFECFFVVIEQASHLNRYIIGHPMGL